MKLTDFKALTFDCYGTLIDWESGMVEALKPLTSRIGRDVSRNEILQAHARHESSQQLQTPAKNLSGPSAHRLQAAGRRMGRLGLVGRMRRLRPLRPRLAGVHQLGGGAAVSQKALQTGHSFQCRQRELCRQQQEAASRIRRHLYGGRRRRLQAVGSEFRVYAREAEDVGDREASESFTPPRACSMITDPRTVTAWRLAGFIAGSIKRASGRRCIPAKCQTTISGSTAWPNSSRPIRRNCEAEWGPDNGAGPPAPSLSAAQHFEAVDDPAGPSMARRHGVASFARAGECGVSIIAI